MKKVTLALHCDYSPEELNERRDELATVVLRHHEVERQKADSMKDFKERLDALDTRRDQLAHQIRDKGEPRAVECAVDMNRPQPGIKRTSRLDTGEFVKDELMTDQDRQQNLFAESEEIRTMFDNPDTREPEVPPIPPNGKDLEPPPATEKGFQ
jgi:hypothetical protein